MTIAEKEKIPSPSPVPLSRQLFTDFSLRADLQQRHTGPPAVVCEQAGYPPYEVYITGDNHLEVQRQTSAFPTYVNRLRMFVRYDSSGKADGLLQDSFSVWHHQPDGSYSYINYRIDPTNTSVAIRQSPILHEADGRRRPGQFDRESLGITDAGYPPRVDWATTAAAILTDPSLTAADLHDRLLVPASNPAGTT